MVEPTTNTLAVRGKNNSSQGFVRFGSDSKYFGYTGTYLYYGTSSSNTTLVARGERVGIGNLANNPSTLLHLYSNSSSTVELRLSGGNSAANNEADTQIRFTGGNNGTGEGFLMRYDNSNGQFFFDQIWTGVAASTGAMRFRVDGAGTPIEGMHLRGDGGVTIKEILRTEKQISSSVATGTAPISVTSTTECTNLNAARLQGYSALGLPYLGGSVNTNISSTDGVRRFYFGNNSFTVLDGASTLYFQIGNANYTNMHSAGYWNFGSSNTTQTSYRIQVQGASGLNLNTSSTALSSGQRSVVLRAEGDKQFIDTYGVFKRNRKTIGESITVANGDACISGGDITINSGATVTISSGGSWSIV